ncbi:gamma-glutamylcyclotransferase [Elysia marginata]|uniref:glutathione-specific gamma-glutamylcyclotransferase n=1 Tax=Elysia marginata TaxID=1093978 RepID=A0AAV4EGT2_9GAST|nr:gamma-glutamylcyclotransferase [Elysia marginata]
METAQMFSAESHFDKETRDLHATTFVQQDKLLILTQNNELRPTQDYTVQESSAILNVNELPGTSLHNGTDLSRDTPSSRETAKPCHQQGLSFEKDTCISAPVYFSKITPGSETPYKPRNYSTEGTHLSKTASTLQHVPKPCPTNHPDIQQIPPVIATNPDDINKTISPSLLKPHISLQQKDHQISLLKQQHQNLPAGFPLQHQDDQPTLWVFGYGSLMWKTDFAYRSKQIGFIQGHERRFYLGNTTFRGRPGQPGRVANLVEVENGKTWGVAFEVHGQEEVAKVLKNLFAREVVSGGYLIMSTSFFPRESPLRKTSPTASFTDSVYSLAEDDDVPPGQSPEAVHDFEMLNLETDSNADFKGSCRPRETRNDVKPIQVILFTVTEKNELYLGHDDVDKMASQIVNAKGSAGSNVEYVTKTADFVRTHIPEDDDTHLFQLDAKVRELVYKAQAHDVERVRLGLSDIAHELRDTHRDRPQATVRAS